MNVYLCGAIFGKRDDECVVWRRMAREALEAAGHHAIDPMDRDYRGREDSEHVRIVLDDIADIRASDALLVMARTPSWGTAMEVREGFALGKVVVSVVDEGRVSPWLRYHSHRLCYTLSGAIDAIVHWNAHLR